METSQELVDQILEFMQTCGYDDFVMEIGFDMPGITGEGRPDQITVFAEKSHHVMKRRIQVLSRSNSVVMKMYTKLPEISRHEITDFINRESR